MLARVAVRDKLRFPDCPLGSDPFTVGGGATTLIPVPRVGFPLPAAPVRPEVVTDGGGGTIFAPRFVPSEVPREVAEPAFAATPAADGGGGTMLAASVPVAPPLAPPQFVEETAGGGGTTSWVPKSLPMMLLTIDELFAWEGGGGTTAGEEPRVPPLSSLRRSRGESAEGGGATTAGAGSVSLAA